MTALQCKMRTARLRGRVSTALLPPLLLLQLLFSQTTSFFPRGHTHSLRRRNVIFRETPASYEGPIGSEEDMVAALLLEELGLVMEVGPSCVVPGELGTFCRVADGVEEATLPALTLLAGYAKGTFNNRDKGDKTVGFRLRGERPAVFFERELMSVCEAMERASEAHGCECGLAGHTVTEAGVAPDDNEDGSAGGAAAAAFDRFFIPNPVEDLKDVGITNLGQFSNDLAWGNPGPEDSDAYEARADANNCLQLVWRVEFDEEAQQLVPSWPVSTLSRDLTFTNTKPMEIGCTYGWAYWSAALLLDDDIRNSEFNL